MAKRIFTLVTVAFTLFMLSGCDDGKLNLFTLEQDIEFGEQLDLSVMADPATYPILDKKQYPEAYENIERILNTLLQSKDLRYANRFPWEVKIINADVLNAFAAPGGKMYFYTGLIKYLENEAQFAGVMAHEMAHADRRHSTQMLTKEYGFSLLASIVLGDNPSMLEQIIAELAQGLGNLKYSRNNEYEADEYAVHYLYDTGYHPRSIANFFERMEAQPSLVFLSTHPSPDDRVEAIEKVWQKLGGKDGELYEARYTTFKNSLP